MSTASTPTQRMSEVGVFSWIRSLFALNPEKFRLGLGLVITAIALVPLLILSAVGHQDLWLSFIWGVLYTRISDAVVKEVYATTCPLVSRIRVRGRSPDCSWVPSGRVA